MAPKVVSPNEFPRFVIAIDDESRIVACERAQLRAEIEALAVVAKCEVFVTADLGPRPWWHRLFGVRRYVQLVIGLEWDGDAASVCFFDDGNEEFLAVAADDPEGKRFRDGDLPVAKETALRAVREYLTDGQLPSFLNYRYSGR